MQAPVANAFTLSNDDYQMSRHQHHRGMLAIKTPAQQRYSLRPYGYINGRRLREALDQVTVEDETATVRVRVSECIHGSQATISLDDRDPARVKVIAPCGETRRWKLTNLDRALTRLGF